MKQTSIKALIFGVFAAVMLTVPLTLHSQTLQTEQVPEEEVVYYQIAVDKAALYPSNTTASENPEGKIRYPERALKKGIEGCTRVRFVIEEDGSIGQVAVIDDIDKDLAEEAMRVVNLMPKWEPAILYDKPVRSFNEITIAFCVSKDDHSDYHMHIFDGYMDAQYGYALTIPPIQEGVIQVISLDNPDNVRKHLEDKDNKKQIKKPITSDKHACFPGGDVALYTFLQRNLRYPEQAQIDSIQGRVIVRFAVNRDGDLEQVGIAKGVCEELDQEAVRVVKLMPKWEPGMYDGKPERSYFSLPITFSLPPKAEKRQYHTQ